MTTITTKRGQNLIGRLRRQLARIETLPLVDRAQYKREANYYRAVTMRKHRINRLRRQIKHMQAGLPFATWHETTL